MEYMAAAAQNAPKMTASDSMLLMKPQCPPGSYAAVTLALALAYVYLQKPWILTSLVFLAGSGSVLVLALAPPEFSSARVTSTISQERGIWAALKLVRQAQAKESLS